MSTEVNQNSVEEQYQVKPRSRENAMLVLQRGAEAGRRWPLDRTRSLTIGRSEECDIALPDRQVSRQHARITWQGDCYELEDLGSKNGTHLNGQDINTPLPLHDGDEIQIALRFKLAFVDAGATAPLTIDNDKAGLRLDKETRQVGSMAFSPIRRLASTNIAYWKCCGTLAVAS